MRFDMWEGEVEMRTEEKKKEIKSSIWLELLEEKKRCWRKKMLIKAKQKDLRMDL